jgi:predicted nucleic acid-binding protein
VATPDRIDTLILDSWPVMEWLQQREPATTLFDGLLERALRGQLRLMMSRINFGEILYSCWKLNKVEADRLFADAEALPVDIISVDDDLVIEAARLKATCNASYADCFAAALAIRHDVPVVTGDKEFLGLVKVQPRLLLNWLGV